MVTENLSAVHLLWLLALLPLLAWWAGRRTRRMLRRMFSAEALPRLNLPPERRRWLVVGLRCCGLLFLVLVLMDFRSKELDVEVRVDTRGVDLVVLLDVSQSMLAIDASPSRLGRARLAIADLARETIRAGDRIGLVLFAGTQEVKSPLTLDRGFFLEQLDAAGPGQVSRGGTLLGDAIRRGLALFPDADAGVRRGRVMLLLTDGEDQGSFPLDAAGVAAEQGVIVCTVGLGDPSGAAIRLPDQSFLTYGGEVVTSRLDEDTLRRIADITRGAYVPAGTRQFDLDVLYRERLAPLARGQDREDKAIDRQPLFQIPLLGAIICLLAELFLRARRAPGRRSAAALVACVLLAAPVSAQEGERPPSLAELRAMIDGGQAPEAQQLLEGTRWPPEERKQADYALARSLYAQGSWKEARNAFAGLAWEDGALGRGARVGRAHCSLRLAEQGGEDAREQVVQAIGDYRSVLAEDPSRAELRADIEIAKQLLRRLLEQEQEQQDGEPQPQEGEQQDGEQQDGEQQEGEQQEGEQQPQEGEQQEGEQQPQEGEQQEGEQQEGEQQEGEQQEGEQQEGEQQEGEQQEGEQQDGEPQPLTEQEVRAAQAQRLLERLLEQLEQQEERRQSLRPPPQPVERDW